MTYNNIGRVYLDQGRLDEAADALNQAIELDPDLANAYAARGSAYFYMGEHERGMADLNRAIELDPNLVMAYYNRGTANLNLGEYEQAIADYERVLELTTDPDLRRMAEAELERLEGATSPAAAAPLTLHPYEHSSGAFLIHIPEDWKVLTIDDQVTTMFLDSEEEEGMMVSTFEGQSIADFAEQRVIEFMEQMEMEYEILEQQDLTEDYLYISVATLNEDWMFDFHFGEREDVGLILTLWAHEGSNLHRSWDSIVQSFIFTPGAAR
jgi:tetratricopeptide (TPR) repeat protein